MKNEGALRCVFEAYGIYRSDVSSNHLPLGLARFPVEPVSGYRTRRKEHALPIVRDEFRPAIPRRVARQHCPSPLHRHHQLKTIAASKEIIYHRTVPCLLTVCLSPGGRFRTNCKHYAVRADLSCLFGRAAWPPVMLIAVKSRPVVIIDAWNRLLSESELTRQPHE